MVMGNQTERKLAKPRTVGGRGPVAERLAGVNSIWQVHSIRNRH